MAVYCELCKIRPATIRAMVFHKMHKLHRASPLDICSLHQYAQSFGSCDIDYQGEWVHINHSGDHWGDHHTPSVWWWPVDSKGRLMPRSCTWEEDSPSSFLDWYVTWGSKYIGDSSPPNRIFQRVDHDFENIFTAMQYGDGTRATPETPEDWKERFLELSAEDKAIYRRCIEAVVKLEDRDNELDKLHLERRE